MTYECTCAHRQRLTLDEAYELADAKATLDWIPVVKATVEPDPILVLAEAMKASMDRPPAVINVTTPEITVESPVIHNHLPEQEAPQVTLNIPEAKATTKRVIRDDAGRITEVIEE